LNFLEFRRKMLIGVDLDNTILNHRTSLIAISRLMGLENVGPTKTSLKKAIIDRFGDAHWTFAQALIYGPLSMEAEVYSGFYDFLERMHELEHQVCIVSHRTEKASGDERINLKNYARLAVDRLLGEYSSKYSVYTENTIEEKLRTINRLNCDVFVDDLPHVLDLLQQTGSRAIRILYRDSADSEVGSEPALGSRDASFYAANSWFEVIRIFDRL